MFSRNNTKSPSENENISKNSSENNSNEDHEFAENKFKILVMRLHFTQQQYDNFREVLLLDSDKISTCLHS